MLGVILFHGHESCNLASTCLGGMHVITFEFRLVSGGGNFQRTALVNSSGVFSLANIPRGHYKVWVKGRKWLADVMAE